LGQCAIGEDSRRPSAAEKDGASGDEQHFTAARAGFLCGRGIRVVGDVVQLSDAGDHHWPADAVSVDAAYAHCAAKFVGALSTERESSVIGVLTRDRFAIDSDVLRVIRARESD